jgi:hypothetical protein
MESTSNKTKITSLTKEQEAEMPNYVTKWVNIATSTKNVEDSVASEIVADFRKLIGRKEAPLLVVDNPIEAWIVCCLHHQGVTFDNLVTEMKKVFGGCRDYIIPQASLPFNDIGLCGTFSFYDYVINVLKVEFEPELLEKYKTWEKTSNLWAIYPMEEISVVCRKPVQVHLNENRVLHCDGGPALQFAGEGQFEVYCLNGVVVPEWLAVTPAENLNLEDYNKITNADVKAEFVRKVGIEMFLTQGVKMDTYSNYSQEDHVWWWKSEYELWDMSAIFPGLESAPFLKMLNPTTKIWHMEGVSPSCKTLGAALKERFGGRDMKIIQAA